MGFVDHHHVPPRRHGLLAPGVICREIGHAANRKLAAEKRILLRFTFLQRHAALLVVDAEPQVESTQQLDEPLVNERFGYEDQDAAGFPDREESLHDQARLNRLAEPDLVGEQHARNLTCRYFMQDVELM